MTKRKLFAILKLVLACVECSLGVIQLHGEGASFPYPAYKNWIQSFKNFRQTYVTVNATYTSTGSGSGQKKILAKSPDLEYVGSDSLLAYDEWNNKPDLVMFPTLAGGTVMGYNVPECDTESTKMNLTREHLVGIYNGTFQYWNDSSIADANPRCTLPYAVIRVIARADKSGTTSMFTAALSSFSNEWNSTLGVFSEGVDAKTDAVEHWNASIIRLFGQKTRGVAGLILSLRYTIGYLSVADASEASISYATLQNKDGRYVRATTHAIQGAMDRWAQNFKDVLTGTLADQPHPDAYPIAGFTYIIVYKTSMTNCHSLREFLRYVLWFMKDKGAQETCESVYLVPLSEALVAKNIEMVLKKMSCHGRNLWDIVQADIAEEKKEQQSWVIPVAILVPSVLVILGLLLGYIWYQRWRLNKMIDNDEWDIPIEDIIFYLDEKILSGGKSRLCAMKSIKSLQHIDDIPEGSEMLDQILQWPGKWNGHVIGIRVLEIKQLKVISRDMKKLLLSIRDTVIHPNVVRFFGITNVDSEKYVIGEYCGKGQMADILQDEKYNLTNDFKFAIASDIANGMNFLHNHDVVHGNLTSSCCLIDSRWTVKVADWEYCRLFKQLYAKDNPLTYIRKDAHSLSKYAAAFRDFWVAPEIIKSDFQTCPSSSTDVYSFAIILQEIFTREDPYSEHAESLSPDEVIRAVVSNNLRPAPPDDAPVNVRQIMEIGWSDNPGSRPTFEQITKMLRQSKASRKSMLDSMMEAMEEYTAHLEARVEEKTSELAVAKRKLEMIMKDIIPSHLVKRVSNGQQIATKVYCSLGVIMAEVVNIRDVVDRAPTNDVVRYLNAIHSEIESYLNKRDTYRVYLQCDSFTVVVGLKGNRIEAGRYAESAANVALDIVMNAGKVTRPPSMSKPLEFRLSAHVGSVATGVVGTAAPKFVVMGETIDVTSALLSHSASSKVRISASMYNYIHKKSYFFVEAAEEIMFNGGTMSTFWLRGRNCVADTPSEVSADSGVHVEKQRSDSCISKTSSRSRDSIKSRASVKSGGSVKSTSSKKVTDSGCVTDAEEELCYKGRSSSETHRAMLPIVFKPPRGKTSKNKVHPSEVTTEGNSEWIALQDV